ncbi:MAG: PD-(D/E)XK nuclease family protein [Bacteroidales bacterium]|nr:PD-(D/E)XK nuclease family protein [Bacteroidales bacterium]MCM1147341.1 PD-(D/E)XK nuclease family protein [Bacteroidales bacterium]MCM1206223.1 PD-(D/E)XK nuclease family protein [Bacillota bacterium]MCM1510457.1 PD-(D/E)XK nuclease family protein [Clostridium sp.]
MQTYIEELAQELYNRFGNDLSKVAVVFPNKRAALFLNEALARLGNGTPIWSPAHITISELFRSYSGLEVADQILLICRLHTVFQSVTGYNNETLDRFYGWGQLLLADFDDLDKNMADAEKVFQVITDLHQLDNDEYLSDSQRETLKTFFKNFTDDNTSKMREKFMHLWSRLYEIYTTFREELRNDGLAYEGMLYRDVAETKELTFDYDAYYFCGFNWTQKVEQRIFERISLAGKATFRRDDKEVPPKNVTYISAPTETLQARYVHDWLLENDRYKDGAKTAIVMADEHLLQTIIRSLPDCVDKVNITTGFPLSQSPAVSLLQMLIDLQTAGRLPEAGRFNKRYARKVDGHPFIRYIREEHCQQIYHNIDDIFIEGYDEISNNAKLTVYLQDIIKLVAQDGSSANALDKESFFRIYQILQRLLTLITDGTLIIDIVTYRRLLTQIISSTTVPYHGEPIEGIQIMGVLETRCLDFDHVLLLSCNEGNMPKGVNDSSFIPHTVRKAYGMTTVENKVGIYEYYFHRLLQRTTDVTLAYNSSTEGINTGEMSRFMLQLMAETDIPIRRISLQTGQDNNTVTPKAIAKASPSTESDTASYISPSSLSSYLRCQVRYYYEQVLKLREQDSDDIDELDNRIFGNIFHYASELAYKDMMDKDGYIHADILKRTLSDDGKIARYVDTAFREELFMKQQGEETERYTGIQIINRRVIIRLLKDLLRHDLQNTPFRIAGLEIKVSAPLVIGNTLVTIGGYIDRLDIVGNERQGYTIRVVDYKTGFKEQGDMSCVEDIFDPANISRHSDYYLQTMLYSIIVRNSADINPNGFPVSPALMFVQKTRREGYSPILKIADNPIKDIKDLESEYVSSLAKLIAEIRDINREYIPTPDKSRCKYCPFRQMCGV